jgi:hypothetical protein
MQEFEYRNMLFVDGCVAPRAPIHSALEFKHPC